MSIEVFKAEPTLAELAVTINTEYRLANTSAWDAVRHAIVCGEALLEAQRQAPAGGWLKWVTDNIDIERSPRERFMRLAAHKDLILIPDGPTSIKGAFDHLKYLGVADRRRENGWKDSPIDVAKAKKLRADGLNYNEIVVVLGASWHSVKCALDPVYKKKRADGYKERKRQRLAEKNALAAKGRDDAVKRHGGSPAEGYALLRRCALVIDGALIELEDAEYRDAMRSALAHVHKAEDQIVRALRIGRQKCR